MARDDPQMKIRLPGELKMQIDAAAADSGRTLNAEIVDRLQRTFGATGLVADLTPTVVRLERDVARLEVDKAAETLMLRLFATALRPLLDGLPDEQKLEGILQVSAAEWRKIADTAIAHKIVRETELDASFARLKDAESMVRKLMPEAADPLWERIGGIRELVSSTNKKS